MRWAVGIWGRRGEKKKKEKKTKQTLTLMLVVGVEKGKRQPATEGTSVFSQQGALRTNKVL